MSRSLAAKTRFLAFGLGMTPAPWHSIRDDTTFARCFRRSYSSECEEVGASRSKAQQRLWRWLDPIIMV
jgi:hypothetical protein